MSGTRAGGIRGSLPLVGILTSAGLFIASAVYFPGGYDWTHQFISTLFNSSAFVGPGIASKWLAIVAMLLLCVSVAAIIRNVAGRSHSRQTGKTIEIGGIGSMVYAFLAVTTPMHDLLVSISLVFFLAALLAALRTLHVARQTGLVIAGCVCFAWLIACAVIYYGHVLFFLLPVGQKVAFILCVGWLVAVNARKFEAREGVA